MPTGRSNVVHALDAGGYVADVFTKAKQNAAIVYAIPMEDAGHGRCNYGQVVYAMPAVQSSNA